MLFDKKALSLEDQIRHLQSKGLLIKDEERAKRYLVTISLYRLKGFGMPFCHPRTHAFFPNTDFDDMRSLYVFDRKLRLLVIDALERIEIAVRSVLSNIMSEKYGSHWFLEEKAFTGRSTLQSCGRKSWHGKLVEQMEFCAGRKGGGKHPACDHYFLKYADPGNPVLPPSWIMTEVMTMGTWSQVYSHIRKVKFKKEMAAFFGFRHDDFEGWLHAVTLIRNICAHHQRIWNRRLPPKASNVETYTHEGINVASPYCNFAIVYRLLSSITPHSRWNERFYELVMTGPVDMPRHADFPMRWAEREFWGLH